MSRAALQRVAEATVKNWRSIEPSIFGTLFERALDATKRSQLGAHYTSAQDIASVVEPVLMEPLRREWDTARREVDGFINEENEAAARMRPGGISATPVRGGRAGPGLRQRPTSSTSPCAPCWTWKRRS